MTTNEIQNLIEARDNETDAAKIEALQIKIDAAVDALPKIEEINDGSFDRLMASLG
jgi:hypothetical protein